MLPISPRWLYSIGRADRAREILARFHSSTNDVRSPLVDLEMREIEEKIQIDGADSTLSAHFPICVMIKRFCYFREVVGLQAFVYYPCR